MVCGCAEKFSYVADSEKIKLFLRKILYIWVNLCYIGQAGYDQYACGSVLGRT